MNGRLAIALLACAGVATLSTAPRDPVDGYSNNAHVLDNRDSTTEAYDATTQAEALAHIARAGLYQLDVERIVVHVHSELVIYVDDIQVVVPQVGVDLDTLTAAPVHTHGTDGILHIEADEAHADTALRLADFLAVLGAGRERSDICAYYQLSDSCSVDVTVDGLPAGLDVHLGDQQRIVLSVRSQPLYV